MNRPLRILVVDDEAAQREILGDILADAGHDVRTADSGEAALEQLRREPRDLLLTDLRMGGIDGVELTERAQRLQPRITVILMTAYASVDSAVAAMQRGAYDYLQKPFGKAELLRRVERVTERLALQRENRGLRHQLQGEGEPRLLGESPAMQQLLGHLDRVAAAPGDVLVTGESGTGKELAARHLHRGSARRDGPFVPVNCGAIPENLAESELFGHERGAFTNATHTRVGRFEQADGGTIFLDEVSSLPLALQPKLLRVLQERVIDRVGSSRSRQLDFRVIAATNVDLRHLVSRGGFREDLYHRLNVLEVHLLPLRERRPDIPLLARAFRDTAARRYRVEPPPLESDLLDFLDGYAFPGNVRELEHLIEKMVVLSEGAPLRLDDLPHSVEREEPITPAVDPDAERPDPEELLRGGAVSLPEIEERLLREAIRQSNGNLSEAARRLGITYKTLRYRVSKLEG